MTGGEKNQRMLRLGLLTARASRLGGGVFEAVVAQAQALKAHGGITPIVFGTADEFTAEDKSASALLSLSACRAVARPPSIMHRAFCR